MKRKTYGKKLRSLRREISIVSGVPFKDSRCPKVRFPVVRGDIKINSYDEAWEFLQEEWSFVRGAF